MVNWNPFKNWHPFKKCAKEKIGNTALHTLEFLEKNFQQYEIESIVAEIQLKTPRLAKGSLKVKMKKKNREQNTEVIVETEEMKSCLKS